MVTGVAATVGVCQSHSSSDIEAPRADSTEVANVGAELPLVKAEIQMGPMLRSISTRSPLPMPKGSLKIRGPFRYQGILHASHQ